MIQNKNHARWKLKLLNFVVDSVLISHLLCQFSPMAKRPWELVRLGQLSSLASLAGSALDVPLHLCPIL